MLITFLKKSIAHMKHLKFLFIAVVVAVFASCSQSDVEGGMQANARRAEFSGEIGRASCRERV